MRLLLSALLAPEGRRERGREGGKERGRGEKERGRERETEEGEKEREREREREKEREITHINIWHLQPTTT